MCCFRLLSFSTSSTCIGLKIHTKAAASCGVTYSTGIVGRNIHLSGSGAVVEGIPPPCFCKGIYFILLPSFCEKLEFICGFFLVFFPSLVNRNNEMQEKCNFIILERVYPWEFSSKL